MRGFGSVFGIAIVVLSSFEESRAAQFIPLGDFAEGVFVSNAQAISPDGQNVAGAGSRYPFARFTSDAFFWNQASGLINLQTLPLVSAPESFATGVADNGVVVGTLRPDTQPAEAFRWTQSGGLVTLGFLPGGQFPRSFAEGVSSDGRTIVGWSSNALGTEAFYWTSDNGMQGLGDSPGGIFSSQALGVSDDGAVIVGLANTVEGPEAFRWTAATGMIGLGDIPGGGFGAFATDVSADGSVIVGSGSSERSGVATEAFRWTEIGGFQPLGILPGNNSFSQAKAVSGDGSVVVGVNVIGEGATAITWDKAHGLRKLQSVLTSVYGLQNELAGWNLQSAQDISSDGLSIVGSGINPDGNIEAWLVRLDRPITVPEPTAAVLLIAACALISAMPPCRKS